MISVVIPTLNAESRLADALTPLVPAVVDGIVREVIVVDGGSRDRTIEVADHAGATVVRTAAGRGQQLAAGACRARGPWLLFLHADSVLETGWEREAAAFMEKVDLGERSLSAAAFRYALDDDGVAPRLLEVMVRARGALLSLPYGDQGLLIPRRLYEQIGGYKPMAIMEDVDIVRRLGRGRIAILRTRATTSAERYRSDGYLARVARNQLCLALYAAGVSPVRIAALYRGRVALPAERSIKSA
jgi:rSAM/selenodomain-associated transferase 2